MPTISNVVNAAVPAGLTLAQWLASRNSLNTATNTLNTGATAAGVRLNTASDAAIKAQKDALATQQGIAAGSVGRTDQATAAALDAQKTAATKQQGVYDTTVGANKPYSEFGAQGIKQLQDLQANPSSLTSTPGYQFELTQGLEGQQRAAAAAGTMGSGAQVKAGTRYALDYANTKYNDAFNRLMQSTGVGERANAANANAGVTLGNQAQVNASEVGDINRTGANTNNATMGTLGTQTGTAATNTGIIGTQNAEDQAALTLASAEAQAENQGLQANNTSTTLDTIAGMTPTIAKAFGIGGTAAATGAGVAAGGGAAIPAATGAFAPVIAHGGASAALGLGGGSGLLGLGAATIPVVGGIIAGGALLAKHFIGQGRKTADKLTGQGGIQHAFEDTLNTIDSQPGYTEAQKWQSKEQAYEKLKELGMQFAKKGSNERKVASQMFDSISHLFGDTNPLKATA